MHRCILNATNITSFRSRIILALLYGAWAMKQVMDQISRNSMTGFRVTTRAVLSNTSRLDKTARQISSALCTMTIMVVRNMPKATILVLLYNANILTLWVTAAEVSRSIGT